MSAESMRATAMIISLSLTGAVTTYEHQDGPIYTGAASGEKEEPGVVY